MKTEQRYFENKGNSPMYVGNTMIPPGEGKVVEVPVAADAEPPPQDTGPSLAEQIGELLDLSIPKIAEQLPELSLEALDLMEDQERAGKTRKGVMDAIAAERLRRADEKLAAEEAAKASEALEDARRELLQARVALTNLPPGTPDAEREAAQGRVDEAQAKVDALADEGQAGNDGHQQ